MFRHNYFVKLISVFLITVMVLTPILVTAQEVEQTYAQGKMDGERDAKGNFLWFFAGVGCGVFGAGIAYFAKSSPPAQKLIGKTSDYVLGYTEGYQNKSRNKNVGFACGGWAAFVLIYAAAGGFSTAE